MRTRVSSGWRAGLIAVVGLLVAQTRPAGQQATPAAEQAPPSGAIAGRVVDGASGAPLTGVTVTLSTPGMRAQRVIVDGQGRYLFHGLPAGAFTLTATKTRYLDGSYGRLRPDGSGSTLDLERDERVLDSTIRMWRYATISGTVIDDAGDAAPGRVQLYRRSIVAGRWKLVNTGLGGDPDSAGRYRITGLTPGDYALVITSFASTAPASLLSLVDAMRRAPGPDSDAMLTELAVNGAAGITNDLSQRFAARRFGDLLIQGTDETVSADGKFIEHYPTVWYPAAGTPDEASIITIGSGEDRGGIDIRRTLTRARQISGTVTGPAGPVAHLSLRLVPARLELASAEITGSLANSLATGQTVTDANGAFTFIAVPPGQYIIRAMTLPRPPSEPPLPPVGGARPAPLVVPTDVALWAAQAVMVGDADATGVAVTLRPGLRITGRLEFEGAATRPTIDPLRRLRWTFEQADGRLIGYVSHHQAQIDPSGRFYSSSLIPGAYLLRCDAAPAGWIVKSATLQGRDICDHPVALEHADLDGLVVTFTDRPTSLDGVVRDAQGRPDLDATVLVFPAAAGWMDGGAQPRRIRSLRVSRTGSYAFRGLPAGEYHVVAISDALASNWQDPAFLSRLQAVASRASLSSGGTVSVPLTTAGVRR